MPKVVLELPYEVIERIVKNYPGLPIEAAIKQFIIDAVGGEIQVTQLPQDSGRLQKLIQDMINPFTAKVDELARKLGDIIDSLDSLSERIKELEDNVRKHKPEVQVSPPQQSKEARKSAIDVLKDQKVMYERDIASRIRNRDAFFEKLRREGAVVLEAKGQRIAVEPDYWREFKEVLQSLTSSNELELKDKLGKVGYSLLKTLWEGGIVYYDAINKKWKFTEELEH